MKLLLVLLLSLALLPGKDEYIKQLEKHRKAEQKKWAGNDSPIKNSKERKRFPGLQFYPIDPAWKIEATFTKYDADDRVIMPTSAHKEKEYAKYGILNFKIKGMDYDLIVYQNVKHRETEEYKNALFVPFTDQTNGNQTYGGGRYMDLTAPLGEKVILDFNYCYNPYCAYSDGYNCTIPPPENFLAARITAGIKGFLKK